MLLFVDRRERANDENYPLKLRVPARKLKRGRHKAKVVLTLGRKHYRRSFRFRRC